MWDFYRKGYDFPILKQINIPVKVILGSKDEFVDFPEFGVSAQSVLETIKENIKDSQTVLLSGSDHGYRGFENELATEVSSFA